MTTRSSLLRWLAGIALLLVALYAFGEWRMWPWARAPLERWLAGTLQREIAIGGDFGLRTLGAVTVQSDRLVLGGPKAGPHPPERAQAPEFLRAERVRLVLPYATLFALWRGTREPLRVRSLDVERLELALVREADGSANWTFGADKPASGEPAIPRFDRLIVQRARVWIDDAVPDLSLVVNLQTREGVALADSGKNGLEAQAEGSFRGLPLEATARSSGVLPIAAGAGAPAVPLRLWLKVADNTLDLDGTVRDLMQLSALDAEFRLAGSSLGAVGDAVGVSLPTTPPFRAQGRVSKDGAVWQSTVAAFVIGSSRLEGDFSYDPGIAPPLLAGSLRGKRLALSDLGPAVTSVGPVERKAPAANERRQRGRVLPRQPFNLPALDAMQAEVDVDLDRLDLGAQQLAPVTPLRGRVVLKDSVLAIENLRAGSAGGELQGRIWLDARPEVPQWHGDLRWSGIQLDRFLTVRDTRAASARNGGPAPGYVVGMLSGTARLAGSGNSIGHMLGSLDGSVRAWVQNGAISELLVELLGLDVAESLGLVLLEGGGLTPLRCAVADLRIDDGMVRPEVAVIDTPDSTFVITGQVALGPERLDLSVHARPKDASLVTLRGPLHVRGTFQDPKVELEKRNIGLRAAAAIALGTVVAPLAGLLALIDLGEGDTAICKESVQEMKPAPGARSRR